MLYALAAVVYVVMGVSAWVALDYLGRPARVACAALWPLTLAFLVMVALGEGFASLLSRK